jgi:transposase-like protein
MPPVIAQQTTGPEIASGTPRLPDIEPMFNITEFAKIFGVTRGAVYQWVHQGKARPLKVRGKNGQLLFTKSEVLRIQAAKRFFNHRA